MSVESSATFLVEGPFQLLGAIEARHYLRLEPRSTKLILILPGPLRLREQLHTIVAGTDWPNVVELPARTGSLAHVRRITQAKRIARRLPGVAPVLIGDYRSPLMRHISAGNHHAWLLDDGNATLWVAERRVARAKKGGDRSQPIITRPRWHQLKAPLARALGLHGVEPGSLTFFTIYDLPVPPTDRVITHDFPWLRNHFATPAITDDTLWLGTNLPDVGGIKMRDYLSVVSQFTAARGHILYAPHHREPESMVAQVQRETGAEIVDYGAPIEWALLRDGRTPREIGGFAGTALHSLPRVLPSGIRFTAARIPTDRIPLPWRKQIGQLYATMHEHSRGRVDIIDML